ncbi:hypothetical protein EG359_17435 [Chryseobacterium joostei]|uniref:Uncharacterized protein n=1 Tax=Chryseobacterium joostei TaxID=112234 RepID=A0A1N7IB70_9FLAO|nr:hypothetical protein [Chryseobacterium joostei]AZB01287.1 hypothetical protein EG359_17435 [Chryseobacterium joostei]SIS34297.1 hypothetical protein SAMN05421768_103688 [Chryseobacterium joostei]
MSAKLKQEESKEVKGEKVSFSSASDYMAIKLNGQDGKPQGETFVEHKIFAKKLIASKKATEDKDAKIEFSASNTQILKD